MECYVKGCRYNSSHVTMGHQCGGCKEYGHGQHECGSNFLINQLHEEHGKDTLQYHKRCSIYKCRFNWSHSTSSHHCRKCNGNHGYSNCPHHPKNKKNKNKQKEKEIEFKVECPICRKENNIYEDQKKVFGLGENCKICLDNPIQIFLPDCGHACLCLDCLKEINKLKIDIDIIKEDDMEEGIIEKAKELLNGVTEKSYCIVMVGQGCSFYVRKASPDSLLEAFFMHGDMWGQYGPGCDDRPKIDYFTRGYKNVKSS